MQNQRRSNEKNRWQQEKGSLERIGPKFLRISSSQSNLLFSRDPQAGASESSAHYVCSVEFVMFLIWVSIGNLDAIFISFNWNKFARMVSGDDYLLLVDVFGSFLWTAALFSGMCGLIIDLFSGKFNRPLLEGKGVMVAGFFSLTIFRLHSGIRNQESRWFLENQIFYSNSLGVRFWNFRDYEIAWVAPLCTGVSFSNHPQC